MQKIFVENMRAFYKFVSTQNNLNLNDEAINKIIRSETVGVIHRGDKINNHIHTLITKHFQPPSLDNNAEGIVSIDLTKKKYLKAIKLINNETINKYMGLQTFDYQIKSKEVQTKRVKKTKYKEEKVYESLIEDKHNEANMLLDEIMQHIEKYKVWANQNETHDEELPKELIRALTQVKNGNTQRAAKTLNNYIPK